MKSSNIVLTIFLLALSLPIFGQQSQKFSEEELQRYEEKVKDITSFYFYLLNTLASKQTSSYEKEIIVTDSYKKYFRNENVQVEDDLDERRVVPTNKKIAAYLKDVDFFFKDARFEYELKEISQHVNEEGIPYFKVALTRRLNAVTVENDTLNNTQERFIEINISDDKELRIASIYTTKLSEKEDLINWWSELSYGWQEIFKEAIGSTADSLEFDQIKKITALKEISIRENTLINTIDPLSKLPDLETIDVAHTRISDLSPLRNLTKINHLDASNTKIDAVDALRYSFALKTLLLDNIQIESLGVIGNLKNLLLLSIRSTKVNSLYPLGNNENLKELYISETPVQAFAPLDQLASLQVLDLSYTAIDSLPDLSAMQSLRMLNISNTAIKNLAPISSLQQLEEIRFDNTGVEELDDLESINSLKKIYCDYTGITRSEAAEFMTENPGTLVVFASDRLYEWWKELGSEWKEALLKNRRLMNSTSPSKEELAELTRMDSMDLSSNNISSLAPLDVFHRIHYLNLSNNNISSVNILNQFEQLRVLDISHNPIENINVLSQLSQLRRVNVEGLEITSLAPLYGHDHLEIAYADSTLLDDSSINFFKQENQKALVIYKTDELQEWWANLEEVWQSAFANNVSFSGNPDPEELHKIIFLKSFELASHNVTDLEPLSVLMAPSEISLDRLPIADITVLQQFASLRKIQITGMPVNDLSPLARLKELENLTLSDTPVEDLKPLMGLINLKILNLKSTQVKNVKPLICLKQLENLNIANTNVRRLKHLHDLEQLQELICYNTKVSPREVEKFKEARPECRVVYYR